MVGFVIEFVLIFINASMSVGTFLKMNLFIKVSNAFLNTVDYD